MSRLVHDPTPRPVILREAHPSIKPDKVRRCTLLQGDVIDRLRELPAESVHCCITSPPYFGLRCYGVDGQIGQEETPQEHIRVIVQVFEEVRRVLRKDGTLWLNYGDCYATSANGRSAADVKALGGDDRTFRDKPYSTVGNGFKPKDLMMMPHRIAIALQEAGWWVRSDIVWSKPNPMPESIADRPTKSHEYVFLLARSERYYYDAEAIRESSTTTRPELLAFGPRPDVGHPGHINDRRRAKNGHDKQAQVGKRQYDGFNQRWDTAEENGTAPAGRNKRTVWTIPTEPYPEAHFATYPTALVKPCVLAGTSERGCCSECGKPWVRVVYRIASTPGQKTYKGAGHVGNHRGTAERPGNFTNASAHTTGWEPVCKCNAALRPCTVLDPFCGSGTTGVVALQYGRHFIGIELNPEYLRLAEKRLAPSIAQEILL